MKILIVDDSRAMRRIIQRTMRQAGFKGYEIVEAENGAEALDLVFARNVDRIGIARGGSKLEEISSVFCESSRVFDGRVGCKELPTIRERILCDVDDADDSRGTLHS